MDCRTADYTTSAGGGIVFAMRRFFRWFAISVVFALCFAIAAGVVGEFFIEYARDQGWYENPSERMDNAMTLLREIVTHPWFLLTTVLFTGFSGGLWLDWALRRAEQTETVAGRGSQRTLAKLLDDLHAEGVHHRNTLLPTLEKFTFATGVKEEQDIFDKWNKRALDVLDNDIITVKERSYFRTLDYFQPVYHEAEGKGPQQYRLEAIWNEKLNRLRNIINRIGST
jgi:hypothetical protein